jgi:hypothetical protein
MNALDQVFLSNKLALKNLSIREAIRFITIFLAVANDVKTHCIYAQKAEDMTQSLNRTIAVVKIHNDYYGFSIIKTEEDCK